METENLWGVLSSRIHKEPESWTGRWGDGREHPHFFIHVLPLNIWTQSENFKNILAIEVPTLDFIECHHLWIRYSYVRVTFLCVGCVCVCVCAHAHTQSCLTLCDPLDHTPPGSSVHGIFQAGILGWVAMPSSRGSSQPRSQTGVSCVPCIGRQITYHCPTWEAQFCLYPYLNLKCFFFFVYKRITGWYLVIFNIKQVQFGP